MYIRHKRKKRYKAILFDFDGVLGKTMEDNYQAWKHVFSKYNIDIDKTEYFLLEGMTIRKIAEHFLNRSAKGLKLGDEIARLKEIYYVENNKFSLYAGVEDLLFFLKEKGYLLGLVSGGHSARLTRSLSNGFLKQFDVVIAGSANSKCKPHPEPYLNAAKKLSLNASDCLVVENAPLGIESAKKAGMNCIAICSTLDRQHLSKANNIIDNLKDLMELLH